MADYTSQFSGSEIDARLAKVPQLQDKLVSGTNIKTLNGESILGSGNITIQPGDLNAVKFVAQTLTDAQKEQARENIGAASLADIADMDFVTATTLPTASASTMGHIYLIGPDSNDNYERYVTQESNGSFSWVSLGSTQIDLSQYATKDEVEEMFPATEQSGIYFVDNLFRIAAKYDEDGFDVAKLSEHFKSLLGFVEIEESGFAIVDEQLRIGAAIDEQGLRAKNIFDVEIIN